jgi:eukaryotic-like serine/threonine-protein kinase
MLSEAQRVECELSSAAADPAVYVASDSPDSIPAREHAQDEELDAQWLSAQIGASVGCSHRIVRHLASGGMGHVFVAEHEYLGAQAAVKVPRYADATGRRIIEAEAKLLAKLEHPNIVRALDVGQLADGRVYLLMEHATGIELGGWLDSRGGMPFERCLAVLKQVASAVDYLHLKGVVHGDIKPANILVDAVANDFIKLVDFGIASSARRDDERSGVVGTPAYMSPEQARGGAWGPASDVYAIAALALQMLTGQPPHDYDTAQDVLTAMLTQPAPTPSARGLRIPELDAVFARGLHSDPSQRFARASAFVAALSEVLLRASHGSDRVQNDNQASAALTSSLAALSCVSRRLGPLCNDRVARRLAACTVALLYIFSVYG